MSKNQCTSESARLTTLSPTEQDETKPKSSGTTRYHFNSIWSIWYCLGTTLFSSYLIYAGIKRFLLYASLPWPGGKQPYVELNAHVGLVGAAIVVMPFFITSSILKVGNLANDGFKLGSSLSTCSRDPPSVLQPSTGVVRNLWLHGVPTAAFLHLISAFCLLLPRTLMDSALINAGFLTRGSIWRTDLDAFTGHTDIYTLQAINASEAIALGLDPVLVRIQGNNNRARRSSMDLNNNPMTLDDIQMPDYLQPFTAAARKNKNARILLPKYYPEAGSLDKSKKSSELSTEERLRTLQRMKQKELPWNPFSPEFINYVFALFVIAVRYPSVFWHTNKKFSILFSFHLMLSGIQIILTLSSFSILYKLLGNNATRQIPRLGSFLLNQISALTLTVLAILTVNASSSAIYFYGFQRFAHFLSRSKRRFHITFDNNPAVARPQMAQVSSIAVLLCLCISYGPILWDLTAIYQVFPNNIILATVVSSSAYLVLWIFMWLFLSVKYSWVFKLRVTVARAFVSSARSIKLVNDVEMSRDQDQTTPILVVGNGRAVAIKDVAPQKAIMGVVNKLRDDKKVKGKEEEIYWLRPAINGNKNVKSSKSSHHKVTFKDIDQGVSSRKDHRGLVSPNDSEDDYAILQDAKYLRHTPSTESNLTLEDPRYVDRNQILAYQREISGGSSDSSPVLVAPDYEDTDNLSPQALPSRHHLLFEAQGSMTPRSTRSNDSGVPAETPSQRSDSVSSSSSSQTPHENSEESGVHSSEIQKLRSNSFDDLNQLPQDHPQQFLGGHPSLHRPPMMNVSTIYGYCKKGTTAESTLAIRRQRNLTQEIKPPEDPIYGTRRLTSFKDQHHNSSFSSSSGIDLDAVPPMPLLEGSRILQSPRGNFRQGKLPPIPQGMIYGRTNGPQGYPSRSLPLGRSSSMRSNNGMPKQYTNTLPHVLPKESLYNTNV